MAAAKKSFLEAKYALTHFYIAYHLDEQQRDLVDSVVKGKVEHGSQELKGYFLVSGARGYYDLYQTRGVGKRTFSEIEERNRDSVEDKSLGGSTKVFGQKVVSEAQLYNEFLS